MARTFTERYRQLVEQRAYRRRAAALGLSALLAPYAQTAPRVPAQRRRVDEAARRPGGEVTGAEALAAAVERAEAEALAAHEAGTCHLSEWSCSWCEANAANETSPA